MLSIDNLREKFDLLVCERVKRCAIEAVYETPLSRELAPRQLREIGRLEDECGEAGSNE
jgi:hypothetical protein